ncbi:MAG: ACP S-malonyltransferase, partial [Chlamydiia bacterium]|nr:ACP S-malonyltransferase [Chlamydiia bacterium]
MLFPGQGAQKPGMGKDFAEAYPEARHTFELADDLLGMHLSKLIFEGSEEELSRTEISQPALFVTSCALLATLQRLFPELKPQAVAGLSLGEYTALFAGGYMGFTEVLELVKKRGELMSSACEKSEGTMAVILGLEADAVEEMVQGSCDLWAANFNCPGQVVISGTKQGVARGAELAKERGARRVMPLAVQGAFHSGLMRSAEEGLIPFLERAPLKMGATPLFMNVSGERPRDLVELKKNLAAQVTKPVRFEQSLRKMGAIGSDIFLEIGPSATLSGMVRKTLPDAKTISVGALSDLAKLEMEIES